MHDVVAEYTGNDHELSRLYVAPGLDEMLSMTQVGGPRAGTYYYTHDGLGSVRTVADAMGDVYNTYDYTAFGAPYQQHIALHQPYGYTGRETNPLSRDMHYRYRNYHPELGRFNARDPLLYTSDANLYSYVSNMPYNWVDPFGLKLEICGPRDYKHSVARSLKTLCPGLKFTEADSLCWKVHMDCPPENDELCKGIYDIVQNGHNNYIQLRNDHPEPIETRYGDDGVRVDLPGGGFKPGKGVQGTIVMRDENYRVERYKYEPPHPDGNKDRWQYIPWSVALAHELGHLSLVNKGLHPNSKRGDPEAEKNSVHWENLGWGKIKEPIRRTKY